MQKSKALHLRDLDSSLVYTVRKAARDNNNMKLKEWIVQAIIEKLQRENIEIIKKEK